MWSLGMLIRPLLVGDSMTNCVDTVMGFAWGKETIWSSGPSQNHLVQINALLGLAPKGLLELGRRTSLFYDFGESLALKRNVALYWSLTWFSENIKYLELVPKEFNFENTLTNTRGEDKMMFLFHNENAQMETRRRKYGKGITQWSLALHRFRRSAIDTSLCKFAPLLNLVSGMDAQYSVLLEDLGQSRSKETLL